MPMILLFGADAPLAPGDWHAGEFVSTARAERTWQAGSFRTYAQGRTGWVTGEFVSVGRGGTAWRTGQFMSRALGVPTGSPLGTPVIVGTPGQGGAPLPGTPVTVIIGGKPVQLEMSCTLGKALKASYEHTGENESATITLRVPRDRVPGNLTLTATLAGQLPFTTKLKVDERQWEEKTEKGVKTTTIRLYNEAAYRANTKPLPELVPWVTHPRIVYGDDKNGPPLRTLDVSDLVKQAASAAGVSFALLGGDIFAGETWLETKRETSTGGRTFADVFGETYGAAGYRLLVRGNLMLGVAPGQGVTTQQPTFTRCELQTVMRRSERGHVPGRIRLTAGDAHIPKPDVTEPEPETPEEQEKQDAALSYIRHTPTETGETISTRYVFRGLIRETQEVEIGRVQVTETVEKEDIDDYSGGDFEIEANSTTNEDGTTTISNYTVTRTFNRVLISDQRTTFQYHPACKEALIRQETTKKSYGYQLGTEVGPRTVVGTMFSGSLTGGDLVGNELETVTQEWYGKPPLAGFQKSRRAESSRLLAVQQENAEASPKDRGPVAAREYTVKIETERYEKIGKLWERAYSTTGGVNTPLFDTDSGEAVRLSLRTGTMQSGSELMENEPPKVTWPEKPGDTDADEEQEDQQAIPELTFPQRQQFSVSGGGFGTVQQSFPMLQNRLKLPMLAALIAHANGPRLRQEITLQRPRMALPGDGTVDGVSLEIDGGKHTMTMTTLSVTAPGVTPIPWPPDTDTASGTVVKVDGQQVTVRVLADVTGDGTPIWRDWHATMPKGVTAKVGDTLDVRTGSNGRLVAL